jgi:O-antigen/teichoic acid export membrane protein
MGCALRSQCVNLVLNLFFTHVINAAWGLASQVHAAASNVVSSFMLAVKPQIIKYYAENKIMEMQDLMINASKYACLLVFSVCFPAILEINFILALWLENVPAYANTFCQLFLIITFFGAFQYVINSAVHATGKIKALTFAGGIANSLVPILSYFFFRTGSSLPHIPLLIAITTSFILLIIDLFIVRSLILQFSIYNFVRRSLFIVLPVGILVSILPVLFHMLLIESWERLILVVLSSIIAMAFATYYIVMSKQMRERTRACLSKKSKTLKC